jgi:beta-lactamase class A
MPSIGLSVPERRGGQGWRVESGLVQIVAAVAGAVRRRFPGLGPDDLALTLLLPAGREAAGASYRGDRPVYPASLVKLFYLAALQGWLEAGRLQPSRELAAAAAAMIRTSSNDATALVVDLLSGTTGGPALAPAALHRWVARRRAVNRYFAAWRCPEFAGINLTQKTWAEEPYGRERQACFEIPDNRNRLTSDAIARLLLAISRGEAVSRRRSAAMLKLMARPLPADEANPFNQIIGFLGDGLPAGARLWSKAGWTSRIRHDAAIIELAGGPRFILVACTSAPALAASKALLPYIAGRVVAGLSAMPSPQPSPAAKRGKESSPSAC